MNVLVGDGRGIRGEFSDDLLEDVLERDQPFDIAVLVHDEGQTAAVTLKL